MTTTPGWVESLLAVRYPPYIGKTERFRATSTLKPNFDRNGQEIKGVQYWLGLVFTLGGAGKKSGFFFWGAVLVAAWIGKQKRADLIAGGSSLISALLK